MKRYKHFLRWVELLALFSAVFIADVILHKLENVHAGGMKNAEGMEAASLSHSRPT